MSDPVPASTLAAPVSPGWKDKLLSFLSILAIYYGIQGLTIVLRVTKLIFTADQLQRNPWIALDEHHVWQMVFALALISLFSRGNYSAWGLNFENLRISWRLFVWFVPVCLAILFAVVALPLLIKHQAPTFDYPLTRANVIGWLSFEWILPGPSEEILFRGLIQTYLAQTWKGVWQIGKVSIPAAGILSTLIFCLAHVNFAQSPHVSWSQQFFAFGLGIYYSAAYYRTRSLLAPMLAHNFWDGMVFVMWYVLYWRFH
jgi:membrane protease YdiL (CAAX protease family)